MTSCSINIKLNSIIIKYSLREYTKNIFNVSVHNLKFYILHLSKYLENYIISFTFRFYMDCSFSGFLELSQEELNTRREGVFGCCGHIKVMLQTDCDKWLHLKTLISEIRKYKTGENRIDRERKDRECLDFRAE